MSETLTLFATPVEALLEIVRRHPRRCGVIHGNRPKGWTCRDEMAQAHEKPNYYVKEFGDQVRAGKHLCDICIAVEGLNRCPRQSSDANRRFKLGSMASGWVDIRDSNGKGYGITVARVYSLGRAEIVRDALESAYPREIS